MNALYPLLFHPVYKDYLWGGDRIAQKYQRAAPPGFVAESWEISDRDDGMGIVRNGALAGTLFAEVVRAWGKELLGSQSPGDRFPLLIKIIDARDRLSAQVHPNDETAARFGGEAKTECWYILDAAAGAGVFAGFRSGTTPESYATAVRNGTIGSLMERIAVRPHDLIFIPGGLVHAIDAGCLILEVQQNSNTTYRIDDWGRIGPDGKPRELHLEKASQVIRWEYSGQPNVAAKSLPAANGNMRELLVESPYFRLERIGLSEPEKIEGGGRTFVALFVVSGEVELLWPGGTGRLVAGTSGLIPAALEGALARPLTAHSEIIKTTLPVEV